jgi:hypothetical protein
MINTAYNFSYPSSAAAVVSGVHCSDRAAFRLDRKSPAIRSGHIPILKWFFETSPEI